MSILTLTYRNIDEIRNPRPYSRIRYTCAASNPQGTATHTFETKVGRMPDAAQIVSIEYKDGKINRSSTMIRIAKPDSLFSGAIVLALNETNVEPPVDIYRLAVA